VLVARSASSLAEPEIVFLRRRTYIVPDLAHGRVWGFMRVGNLSCLVLVLWCGGVFGCRWVWCSLVVGVLVLGWLEDGLQDRVGSIFLGWVRVMVRGGWLFVDLWVVARLVALLALLALVELLVPFLALVVEPGTRVGRLLRSVIRWRLTGASPLPPELTLACG